MREKPTITIKKSDGIVWLIMQAVKALLLNDFRKEAVFLREYAFSGLEAEEIEDLVKKYVEVKYEVI